MLRETSVWGSDRAIGRFSFGTRTSDLTGLALPDDLDKSHEVAAALSGRRSAGTITAQVVLGASDAA